MGSVVDRSGIFYLDFRYAGQRCRESTRLKSTPQNKKRCQAALKKIEAEITLGTFDYSQYFPNSPKVQTFKAVKARQRVQRTSIPLFVDFAELRFAEKRVEWRESYCNTTRITLNR